MSELMINVAPEMVTPRQLSARLQISERTLECWRRTGAGPAFVRMHNRRVRYEVSVVEGWLAACRRPGRDEGPGV